MTNRTTAQAVWTLFSETASTATTSVVHDAGVVGKVYFPLVLGTVAQDL